MISELQVNEWIKLNQYMISELQVQANERIKLNQYMISELQVNERIKLNQLHDIRITSSS